MASILEAMPTLGIDFASDTANSCLAADLVRQAASCETASDDAAKDRAGREKLRTALAWLWADSGVRQCYDRNNEFQLQESADFFFNCLDRIFADGLVLLARKLID